MALALRINWQPMTDPPFVLPGFAVSASPGPALRFLDTCRPIRKT
jgi:hypothetical protein